MGRQKTLNNRNWEIAKLKDMINGAKEIAGQTRFNRVVEERNKKQAPGSTSVITSRRGSILTKPGLKAANGLAEQLLKADYGSTLPQIKIEKKNLKLAKSVSKSRKPNLRSSTKQSADSGSYQQ